MSYLLNPHYEIWLSNPLGKRITPITHVQKLGYTQVVNDIGWCNIYIPTSFILPDIALPDTLLEIHRKAGGNYLRMEDIFFIRYRKTTSEYVQLSGPSSNHLLQRRIVAYYAGSAQSLMTGYTDDLMKEVVRDNLGVDAVTGRSLTSVGGGVTVQANNSLGISITKGFAWDNVIKVLQDLSGVSQQNGVPMYFDLVPLSTSTDLLNFDFRTYPNQRGIDHGTNSNKPIFIGEKWGTAKDVSLEENYTDEGNYCYSAGKGDEDTRMLEEVDDDARIEASPWNRCEIYKNASNVDTATELQVVGQEVLNEMRPITKLFGAIIQTENVQYKEEWGLGDKIVGIGHGKEMDCIISHILITLSPDGSEDIQASFEGVI